MKVLEVDSVDFKADLRDRDQSYKDFLGELRTLQQLKAREAENVNQIFDVLEVDSQLWIVSEYCPGGSVHTLVRPCTPTFFYDKTSGSRVALSLIFDLILELMAYRCERRGTKSKRDISFRSLEN